MNTSLPEVNIKEPRRGLVAGFGKFNTVMLSSMKKDLRLFMSTDELELCRKQYAFSEKRAPTLDELYFIDRLAKFSSLLPSFATVKDAFFAENDTSITFSDLIEKCHRVRPLEKSPLSFTDMTEISAAYLKTLGIFPSFSLFRTSESEATPRLVLCDADGKPLALADEPTAVSKNYLPTDNPDLPENTAFVLVCPPPDAEWHMSECDFDYLMKIARLKSTPEYINSVIISKKVDCRGIAAAMSELAAGIYLDPERLPWLPSPFEISYLAGYYDGAYILALKRENADRLIRAASFLELSASYFAKVIRGARLVLRHEKNAPMSLSTAFIRNFTCNLRSTVCRSDGDDFACSAEKSVIRTSNGNSKAPICIGNTLSYAAYAGTDIPGGFMKSVNISLFSLFGILAAGVDRRCATLTIKYGLPKGNNGKSLALILGAYRVMIELCLPDVNSSAEYISETEPSFFCAASAYKPENIVDQKLLSPDNLLYLLSFERSESGLPDFENLRKMCDFLGEQIANHNIVSAVPVCGNIIDAMLSMESEGVRAVPADCLHNGNIPVSELGVIVEVREPIRALCIGATVAKDL